jgi:MSHA pilin protein MshD
MREFTASFHCFRSPASVSRGFTLIEVVVGISIIGITSAMFMALMLPLMKHSVDPQFQIRAAEYAQSIMKEIQSMPYDELTPLGGASPCSPCSVTLGVDEVTPGVNETRVSYDDVDDFNESCAANTANPFGGDAIPGIPATDVAGLADGLDNYFVRICVIYDGDYDGSLDADQTAKLISVMVSAPDSDLSNGFSSLTFHAYRSNY